MSRDTKPERGTRPSAGERTFNLVWPIQFAHPVQERRIQVPGGACRLGERWGKGRRGRARRGAWWSAVGCGRNTKIDAIHTIARWKSGFPFAAVAKSVNCETQRTSPSMSLTFFFHMDEGSVGSENIRSESLRKVEALFNSSPLTECISHFVRNMPHIGLSIVWGNSFIHYPV